MTDELRAFSAHNPNVQLAWDSTSLGNLMFCAYKYKLCNLDGYSGRSIDLDFGIMFHKCREVYLRAILRGASKAEAQLKAVKRAVYDTVIWDDDDNWKPWRGRYAEMWHCKGETKYRNEKGNRAKCPYSHVGWWEEGSGPSICGECGSNTETLTQWVPDDDLKDRYSLVRLVAWWCDDQPEGPDGAGVWPYKFPDGTEAVELPFRIPLPFVYASEVEGGGTEEIEPYFLCGHLDNLGTHAGQLYVVDAKTTARSLGMGYRDGLSPNHQFDTYDLAATIMFPDLEFAGVLVDAASLLKSGVNFGVVPLHKTDAMRNEWLDDIEYWIREAERYAEADHWPMNKRNCWLCEFKKICSIEKGKREMFLRSNFERRERWNPLEEREE